MRFLLDQDVYAGTARLLRGLGHDVLLAAQLGLERADDEVLLEAGRREARILITRDRDFGGLVFVEGRGPGVVYLRMLPATERLVHDQLEVVITSYPEDELRSAFVVIQPHGHRIRRIPK